MRGWLGYVAVGGLGLLLAGLALLFFAPGSAEEPGADRAATAESFINSIGINTHVNYDDTAYGRFDLVRARLRALGVRHVRDGLVVGRRDQPQALRAFASDGIRATLILGDPRKSTGSLDDLIEVVRSDLRGAVAALEGPNEWDASGNPEWAEELRRYQRALYAAVASNGTLEDIPVIGPSLVDRGSRAELGDLTDSLDYGNLHSYPAGRAPGLELASEFSLARRNSGSKPVIATETGYHTAVASDSGHPPVSERAAGIYLPRLFLEYFDRGVRRTFAYELLDERPDPGDTSQENNFGLLEHDFKPKPAYTSLKNLIAVLRDSGEKFTPESLDYSLSGDTDDVGRVLLQRSNRDFYLALWKDASVWDPASRDDLTAGPGRVTLTLPGSVERIRIYRPGSSVEPLREIPGRRAVELDVPADVLLVRISPR